MKDICVAIGCGAIGKSISGYIFSKMNFKVVFADSFKPAIDEMSKGVYSIFVSDSGEIVREDVQGFDAVLTDSDKFKENLLRARVICTAVGPVGLKTVIPQIAAILKEKNDDKAVQLFLFENDVDSQEFALNEFSKVFGTVPEWLDVAGSSIERMTQRFEYINPAVITEKFFPVFVNAKNVKNFAFEGAEKYFNAVENFHAYYYRKLHTNNLGHAILGYLGLKKGYSETVAAISDKEIKEYLKKCLFESGEMLQKEYGFSNEQIRSHIKELTTRYYNMKDDLKRLVRDSSRKLGRKERIVGTIEKCLKNSVDCPNICKLVTYAVDYLLIENDDKVLYETYTKKGLGGVLETVSGLKPDEKVYNYILSNISF